MNKKKIILLGLAVSTFLAVIVTSQDDGLMSNIIAKFNGEDKKNTKIPKEMQEIKSELDNINTGIEKDTKTIEDNAKNFKNTTLDEKIKKMDEKLATINKKEGIDAQAIKDDISAKLKAPIKDERVNAKLKEIDKNILDVKKNMNNLNIKGE